MNIAFVCTGNTCRSPMAEAIFKSKVKQYDEYCSVISCGINAMPGDSATDNAIKVMAEQGIDISSHRSRQINNYIIDLCDHIICMSETQYGIIELVAGDKAILLGAGISDPFGGKIEVYRECAQQISNEIDKLLMSDLFFKTDLMENEDISVVAKIEQQNFSEPWSCASFESELKKDYSMCYVERYLDKPVGYICAEIIEPEAFIGTIAVDESMRRRYVADRLLNMMIDFCQYKNCETLSLEVRASNGSAQNLYKKNGFINIGLRKDFYSKPTEDAYIMTKYFKDENE